MAKRLTYNKKYNKNNTIQIGEDDDAATHIKQIRNQVRQRIMQQKPDIPLSEIERRVSRIISRGMRPSS